MMRSLVYMPVLVLGLWHTVFSAVAQLANGANCESFEERCDLLVGLSTSTFVTAPKGMRFFKLIMSREKPVSEIVLSATYGQTAMYASKQGKEPSQDVNDWQANSNEGMGDVLFLDNWTDYAEGAEVVLVVQSSTDASYRIIANGPQTAATLAVGQPQRYSLKDGVQHQFSFAPAAVGMYLISVTPITVGDVSMSVTGTYATEEKTFTDNGKGAASILLQYEAMEGDIAETFAIIVNATAPSSVGVTLCIEAIGDAGQETPVELLGGLPLDSVLGPHGEAYFVLDVPKDKSEVNFWVSPVAGNIDLYVALDGFYTTEPPALRSRRSVLAREAAAVLGGGGGAERLTDALATPSKVWNSTFPRGDEFIRLRKGVDAGFLADGGRYYITVVEVDPKGWTTSSSWSSSDYSYYSSSDYLSDSSYPSTTFTTSPDGGTRGRGRRALARQLQMEDANGNYVSPPAHVVGTASFLPAQQASALRAGGAGEGERGVRGVSRGGGGEAGLRRALHDTSSTMWSNFTTGTQFTISAFAEGNLVTLQEGVALEDDVDADEYRYYRIYDSNPELDLFVVVTPFGGDPDLYLACQVDMSGNDGGYPSKATGHSIYSSTKYQDDFIHVNQSTVAALCASSKSGSPATITPGTGADTPSSSTGTTYYLAVYGKTSAIYSIMFTHRGGTKQLKAGKPQRGIAFNGMTDAYRYQTTSADDLVISLTSLKGDTDLYVSLKGPASKISHEYSSIQAALTSLIDSVTIKSASVCVGCWVYIGVEAYLEDASYSISVAPVDTSVMLQPQHPTFGAVSAGAYAYYTLTLPEAAHVHLVLSQLSGKGTLLASLSAKRPTLAMYLSQQKPPSGNSTAAAVAAGTVLMAKAAVTGTDNWVPALDLDVGQSASVYVAIFGGAPTGAGAVEKTPLTFSVLAHLEPTTTTTTTSAVLDRLVVGQPQDDVLLALSAAELGQGMDRIKYYALQLPAGHEQLDFLVSATTGTVDLYVNLCAGDSVDDCGDAAHLPGPGAGHYNWTSEENEIGSAESITLTRVDQGPVVYVVCVVMNKEHGAIGATSGGIGRAEYSLLAKLESKELTMVLNKVVRDHIPENSYSYYKFAASNAVTPIQIVVTAESGDPDVYVSTAGRPDMDNSTWASEDKGSDTVDILPTDDDHHCAQGGLCIYHIAVFGYVDSSYSIVVQNGGNATTSLVDGVPQNGYVSWGDYIRYEFIYNHGTSSDVEITLLAEFGDADLYVTLNGTRPSKSNYEFKSDAWLASAEKVVIHPDNALLDKYCGAQPCTIRIAAYGFTDTQFSVTVSTNREAIALNDGQPFVSSLAAGAYDYFDVPIPAADTSVEVSVTTMVGDTYVYASCGPALPFPSSNGASWALGTGTGAINGGGVINFKGSAAKDPTAMDTTAKDPTAKSVTALCHAPTKAHIAVYGATLSTFTIVSSADGGSSGSTGGGAAGAGGGNADGVQRLIIGVAQSASVAYHKFEYFMVKRPPHDEEDFRAEVTSTVGEVDLYVSASWDSRPLWDEDTHTVVSYVRASSATEALASVHEGVTVTSTDTDVCPGGLTVVCSFIIGVLGSEQHIVGDAGAGGGGGAGGNDTTAAGGGGGGGGGGDVEDYNEFTITLHSLSGVIMLQDGVAVEVAESTSAYRYFSIAVIDPTADLSISATPFYGDPDLYVAAGVEIQRPNAQNYTWASLRLGTDTLVIQAADLAKHCIPDPVLGEPCDYYIGVVAFTNSSYSVMASLNRGWANPSVLHVGQPQTGSVPVQEYRYYTFNVPQAAQTPDGPVSQEVVITVTPTDGGSLDLYLSASVDSQPGQHQYDQMSHSWSGSDVVVFGPASTAYCSGCSVYLAVYGFVGGAYSIVVSTGLTRLQGGMAQHGKLPGGGGTAFYSYTNPKGSTDIIEVSVTAISGDPDIYVDTSTDAMPGPAFHHWSSQTVGDDSLTIMPTDDGYCSGCEFVVGVFSFSNATFTVSAIGAKDAVVALVHSRPQSGSILAGKMKYYSIGLTSSADELNALKLSLTMLTGDAEMYVKNVANVTVAGQSTIDIADTHTYAFTTVGSPTRGYLAVPGPHADKTVFLIGVYGTTDATFSLMATFGRAPIMLQSGVPVKAFVKEGVAEFFEFMVDEAEADVAVTMTAISGDPDMFAHMETPPACEYEPDRQTYLCGNWTWASTEYSTDTIFVSHADPCASWLSPQMIISKYCDPLTAWGVGPMMIGVYGYEDSAFHISARLTGQSTMLVSGVPSHSESSLSVVCTERDDRGECPFDENPRYVQVAYFAFQVVSAGLSEDTHVEIQVQPECAMDHPHMRELQADESSSSSSPTSSSSSSSPPSSSSSRSDSATQNYTNYDNNGTWGTGTGAYTYGGGDYPNTGDSSCRQGCPCRPVQVYINSCKKSQCTKADRYPMDLRYKMTREVTSDKYTIFIPNDASNPNNGFCKPTPGDSCLYYMAVIGKRDDDPFKMVAKATTPSGVNVLPCIDPDSLLEGLEVSPLTAISQGTLRYELCVPPATSFRLATEVCSGSFTLSGCDGSCPQLFPTEQAYTFTADDTQTCTRGVGALGGGTGLTNCSTRTGDQIITSLLPTSQPAIEMLHPAAGNYFIGVKGSGTFRLWLEYLDKDGNSKAPVISHHVDGSGQMDEVQVVQTDAGDGSSSSSGGGGGGGGSLQVSFSQAKVTMQGDVRECGSYCRYKVYAMNKHYPFKGAVKETACGLHHMAADATGGADNMIVSDAFVAAEGLEPTQRLMRPLAGLAGGEKYQVFVTVECDAACMSGLFPMVCQYDSMSGGLDPIGTTATTTSTSPTTTAMYGNATVPTGAAGGGGGDGGDGGDDAGGGGGAMRGRNTHRCLGQTHVYPHTSTLTTAAIPGTGSSTQKSAVMLIGVLSGLILAGLVVLCLVYRRHKRIKSVGQYDLVEMEVGSAPGRAHITMSRPAMLGGASAATRYRQLGDNDNNDDDDEFAIDYRP